MTTSPFARIGTKDKKPPEQVSMEPGLQREAFVMHKRGQKVEDIAATLGKPIAWVRAALINPEVRDTVMEFHRNPPVYRRGASKIGGY